MNFPKKYENAIFFRLQRLGLVQKLANSNEWTAIKMQKPPFLVFLAKMVKTGIFIKKALRKFFSHLQALTNCKVSEKSNERFSSNSVTDARTHVRTYRTTPKVSTTSWSRDQKWSKYKFKQPKCIVLGTPKKPEKGQE